MKSPFSGMDPYIETCNLWKDFHGHLIEKIADTVSGNLPPGYVARTGKRSYIVLAEAEEKTEHSFEPDVSVTSRRRPATIPAEETTAALDVPKVEPVALRAFVEEEFAEKFIDIFELEPERRLVTSIEVLSPSNKKRNSPGRRKYLRKRQALLLGKANLVEIDLLRGGERMPMLDPLPKSPYYLLVARAERAPTCHVWPAFFNSPLPPVPIPLARPDPDIPLALQPLIDSIYERFRYDADIDYSQPLTPPLTGEEAAWLKRQPRTETAAARPSASGKRRSRRRG